MQAITRRIFLGGTAGAVLSAAGPACPGPRIAEPWSRFRGPRGSGIGAGDGYPVEFGPSRNVIWKRPLAGGKSSPVLSEDLIVLTAESGDSLQVIAVERRTGKTAWERSVTRLRKEFKNPLNDAASSSAVLDAAGNVYAYFGDFGLVSFDRAGRERWRAPMKEPATLWGAAASPVLAGDTVIVLLDGFGRSSISAFDAATGRPRWEAGRAPFTLNYATPLVRPAAGGGCEVLVVAPNRIAAYDPATGKVGFDATMPPGTMIASPVFLDDDTIVAMIFSAETVPPFPPDRDGDGLITRADIPTDPKEIMTAHSLAMIADGTGDRDGKISPAEWTAFWRALQGTPSVAAFDTSKPGEPRWKYTKGIARVATPLVYQGVVYYVNNGGILTALDARTGTPRKVGRLAGALDNYYASPVAASGNLYFASESGKAPVVKAGGDWSVLAVNDLDEPCYATPALSGGRIYLRTAGNLYCFGSA